MKRIQHQRFQLLKTATAAAEIPVVVHHQLQLLEILLKLVVTIHALVIVVVNIKNAAGNNAI